MFNQKNNLKSNTKSIYKYLNIKSSDVAVTSLPLNYTYGLSIINAHLYKNATIYVTKRLPYTSSDNINYPKKVQINYSTYTI